MMQGIFHQHGGLGLAVAIVIGFGTSLGVAQPANDMFANRITITGTNTVVTGNNLGATSEVGEPLPDGESGGASVWWSWTAPSNGTATISTYGSDFDTILAVYTGSSVSGLTYVAANDDDPNLYTYTSRVDFDAVAGRTYQIAVDGFYGDTGNVTLSVQLGPPTPAIPAPAWSLQDLYGATVSSTNYAGKVVILNFWATWCSPCKAEMPDLVALQDKYRADGLVIVGADVTEDSNTVLSFLSTWTPTVNYQIVMATADAENAYGGINAIPTSFIIDRQNLIRKEFVGTQTAATFEQQILPLLYGNTRLACQRNGNQMFITWPTNAANFTLQSATNLGNPVWTAWPDAPTVVNGANTVQIPATGAPAFFRLQLMTQ